MRGIHQLPVESLDKGPVMLSLRYEMEMITEEWYTSTRSHFFPWHFINCSSTKCHQFIWSTMGNLNTEQRMKDKNKQRVYWHNRSEVCVSAPTVNIKSTFTHLCGDHLVYAPSQWEMTLQCNVISHWLGAYIKIIPVYGLSTRLSGLHCQLISPWTKWPPFWQTTFSIAFSWILHCNLFPRVQLTISQHWFR